MRTILPNADTIWQASFTRCTSHLNSDKKCKAATGLTLEQFEKLAEVFSRCYKPKAGNPYIKKQPVFTNPKEALFFVLHYLKSYPTLENTALYFDVGIHTVSDYPEITKKSLKAALQAENVFVKEFFKNQSEFEKAFEEIEDLTADCTEIPVQRPENQEVQKEYYSGKKRHAVKFLIITDCRKRILYIGRMWSGNCHDISIFKEELSGFDFKGKRTGADLGFQGIENRVCNGQVILPHKKSKGKSLSDFEKKVNRILSSFRVKIENAVSRLQAPFGESNQEQDYSKRPDIRKFSVNGRFV